jgi:hypothetical protein
MKCFAFLSGQGAISSYSDYAVCGVVEARTSATGCGFCHWSWEISVEILMVSNYRAYGSWLHSCVVEWMK